jgi:pimeloyl-ACP methyl ester carboxylesterase
MYDDAEVIRCAVTAIDGPVAVVAHSYGGVPATQGATAADGVAHLVYVAAYLLDEGESVYSFYGRETRSDTSGTLPLPKNPRVALYNDIADEPAARALAQLVGHSPQLAAPHRFAAMIDEILRSAPAAL